MQSFSKIEILNNTYYIKDEETRALANDLWNSVGKDYDFEYGIQIDFENNIATRLGSSVNAITEEVVDFDTVNPYKNRTRCTVADDGTINHFFGEEGYTEDGTDGQVMVYQPKFYYRVEPILMTKQYNETDYTLKKCNYYISNKRYRGYELHPAFINTNREEVDYYLIGAFEGSLVTPNDLSTIGDVSTGLLSSFSAAINGSSYPDTAYATTNLNKSQFISAAQRRGTGWSILHYRILAAEQLLMMIEFGTMNLQGTSNNSALGGGLLASSTAGINFRKNQSTSSTNTGYRLGLGGSTKGTIKTAYSRYTSPIVYRGVENPWGNVSKIIDGITSGTSYNVNIDLFGNCGFQMPSSSGYIKYIGYDEDKSWVLLPFKLEGSNTGIIGDYYAPTPTYNVMCILSGHWNFSSSNRTFCGPFYLNFQNNSTPNYWNYGTRLIYWPQKTENSYSVNLTKIASLF